MPLKRVRYTSTIDALNALFRSLIAYEQKYHMPSDEFYADYLAGKLGDSQDFIEWAGDYQHYKTETGDRGKAETYRMKSIENFHTHLRSHAHDGIILTTCIIRQFEHKARENNRGLWK